MSTQAHSFEKIPADLRKCPHWLLWRLVNRDGKATKIPFTTTEDPASSTDPTTWATFEEAVAAYERGGFSGIGFVFSEDDEFCGIDFDHIRDPQTGKAAPWARDLVKRLDSYTEKSQSGEGIHTIVRAKVPGSRRRKGSVEMYDSGRFFCMTGLHIPTTPATVEDRQAVVNEIHAEIFGVEDATPASGGGEHRIPTPAPVLFSITDRDLIEKASTAKNGADFSAMWRGDWQGAGYTSQSDADAALLSMLRFWTGGDKARAFALFERSGLNREKWTKREDYRERTWAKVSNGEVYSPPSPTALGTRSAARMTEGGSQAADQVEPGELEGANLIDIAARPIDHGDTLLGDRFLCRGGVMLFVGASGIGKSTAATQQDIRWSCGLPAFGIIPARPLKVVTIQAENDEGDTTEQAAGVLSALHLTDEQRELVRRNTTILFCNDRAGDAFLAFLDTILAKYQPDLVRIDPLNAYAAGDMTKGEVIAQFCRQGLNPLLHRHGCGAVIVAHPPKPKDTEGWTPTEWQYAAAGGADLTNWARAVLTIDHRTGIPGTFRFIAAKRGKRIGWFNEDGSPTVTRYFRHSTTGLCWEDVPEADAPAEKARPGSTGAESVAALISTAGGCMEKVRLIELCRTHLNMGERRARTLIDILTGDQGGHHEHRVKRAEKRDAVFISTSSTPPLIAPDNNADNNANNENNATGKALSAPLFAPANNANNNGAGVAERCCDTLSKEKRVTTTALGPITPPAPQPASVEGSI